jgi:hypothetical protein
MLEALKAGLKNDFKIFKDEASENGIIMKTADVIKYELH